MMNLKKILSFDDSKIRDNKIIYILILFVFLSSLINLSERLLEKSLWEENPLLFQSEGLPLFRTGDPAYYLNVAKYLKNDIPITEYKNKLYYPLISQDFSVPVLSRLISYLASDSSLRELFKAGNKLVLISSVLTCIGLFYSIFFYW